MSVIDPYTIDPYTLPTIDFVGGETQELVFNAYSYQHKRPFSMIGCTANFSVVDFTNKKGTPILTKTMGILENASGSVFNILTV